MEQRVGTARYLVVVVCDDPAHVDRQQSDLPCACYLYSRGHAITIPNTVIVGWIDDEPHCGTGEANFGKMSLADRGPAKLILPIDQ